MNYQNKSIFHRPFFIAKALTSDKKILPTDFYLSKLHFYDKFI